MTILYNGFNKNFNCNIFFYVQMMSAIKSGHVAYSRFARMAEMEQEQHEKEMLKKQISVERSGGGLWGNFCKTEIHYLLLFPYSTRNDCNKLFIIVCYKTRGCVLEKNHCKYSEWFWLSAVWTCLKFKNFKICFIALNSKNILLYICKIYGIWKVKCEMKTCLMYIGRF